MAEGGKNVQQSLTIIRGLEDAVQNASRSLLRSDMCLLNRRQVQDDLALLRENLPQALTQAEEIVEAEDQIRETARHEAEDAVAQAHSEAEQIVAEGKAELDRVNAQITEAQDQLERIRQEGEQLRQQLTAQAQQQAQAIVDSARQQAKSIVADGEQQARALVDQDNIFRRAKVAADELTEQTNNQMAQLRQKTFAYLDDVLGQAEKYVGGLVQDVHQERENMHGYR